MPGFPPPVCWKLLKFSSSLFYKSVLLRFLKVKKKFYCTFSTTVLHAFWPSLNRWWQFIELFPSLLHMYHPLHLSVSESSSDFWNLWIQCLSSQCSYRMFSWHSKHTYPLTLLSMDIFFSIRFLHVFWSVGGSPFSSRWGGFCVSYSLCSNYAVGNERVNINRS